MNTALTGVQDWLIEQLTSQLAAVFETMTGERPAVEWESLPQAPAGEMLRWRQWFSGVEGALWINASEADWHAAGAHLLQAAGIDDQDPEGLKSTYLEVASQVLSGLGGPLSTRLGREVSRGDGQEAAAPEVVAGEAETVWTSIRLNLGKVVVTLTAGFENTFLDELLKGQVTDDVPRLPTVPEVESEPASPANSKTFDLLLEVELPVSVSFGRAQVALKDVLKLTTGSIVELSRAVSEPVELIVNNCVIARGEVVVVEGNFGVRILQVVSRQERLRTLN